MKKLFVILAVIGFVGCESNPHPTNVECNHDSTHVVADSIPTADSTAVDSVVVAQ